jgi:hypothetical protein
MLQATPTDYLSGIASSAGISAAAFLLDNQEQLLESNISLDAPISGRQFLLCDVPLEKQPPAQQQPVASTLKTGSHATNRSKSMRLTTLLPPVPFGKPGNLSAEIVGAENEILLLAASPTSYDGRDLLSTDGVQLVSLPSIEQGGCSTCVAFSVTAAAQTAVAAAMHVNVSNIPAFSVQALYFCEPKAPVRRCHSGWTLDSALSEFKQRAASLPTAACAPYKPDDPEDAKANCNPVCSSVNPFAKQGVFNFQALSSFVEVQDWIRKHGAVISRYRHSQ